jgi:hypothetical protein
MVCGRSPGGYGVCGSESDAGEVGDESGGMPTEECVALDLGEEGEEKDGNRLVNHFEEHGGLDLFPPGLSQSRPMEVKARPFSKTSRLMR